MSEETTTEKASATEVAPAKRGRGRPRKNAVVAPAQQEAPQGVPMKRGRPKGSKTAVKTAVKSKRGRPKGSIKEKSEGEERVETAIERSQEEGFGVRIMDAGLSTAFAGGVIGEPLLEPTKAFTGFGVKQQKTKFSVRRMVYEPAFQDMSLGSF